jgi:hypothetical protein
MTTSNAVPYESATSGDAARSEITKILRRFGCSSIGFMDDFDSKDVLLHFVHRGSTVQLRASAKGWAALYLKAHPHTSRMRKTAKQHEADAIEQGSIAINSILRDWVKGQVTAVECGVMSFSAVFLPHMLAADGRPMLEHIAASNLLPKPEDLPHDQ